ncbi:MAG: hypothetical protein SCALA702_22260 [Melioribacteraceae bacterium]|nr:MAG: hypothetical protein SCALA702_22260 [Melioribacteraceae bacterium]
MRKIFIVLILATISTMAQSLSSTSEFKVNNDLQPSTFLQYEPLLYHTSDANYFAVWRDTREGHLTSYGQKISDGFSLNGSNFQTFRRSPIKFINDNSFFTVSESYFTSDTSYYTRFHFVKIIDGQVVNSTEYLTYQPPGCGIGAYGEEVNIIPCDTSLLVVTKMNGPMEINRFDMEGNLISAKRDSGCTVFSGKHTVGMLEDESYAIFYIDPYINPTFQTGLITFYDKNDNPLADSINSGIFSVNKEAFVPSDINAGIKIFDNGNDKYLALALNPDSSLIRAQVFTKEGFPDGRGRIYNLPVNWGIDYTARKVTNFGVTLTAPGEFMVITSVQDDAQQKTYNFQLSCNSEGVFGSTAHIDSGMVFQIADELYLENDNTIVVVSEEENDIFLNKLSEMRPIQSKQLNDDTIGGNENIFSLSAKPGTGVFAAYNNEKTHLGRFISADGSLGDELEIPVTDKFKFLSDGRAILPWFEIKPEGRFAGLVYYSANLDTIKVDTLLRNAPAVASRLTADLLSNDVIVVYTVKNLNEAVVQTFTAEGEFITEADASQFGGSSGLGIIPLKDETFYLVNVGSVLRLNQNLEPVTGTIHTFNNMFAHLEENIFIDYMYSINQQGALYGRLVDIENGNLAEIPVVSEVSWNVSFYGIGNERFIVNYPKNDDIYYSIYDFNGNVVEKDKAVCSIPNDTRNVFKTAVSGNDLYYFWSEINDNSTGQDVYGKVISFDDLTSLNNNELPNSFTLSQNYPNPFNPVTTIRFTLPQSANISLKLYDVLGREVKTILSGELSAGLHQTELNASTLSSGVYFYRLESNDGKYNDVKKLMLLK